MSERLPDWLALMAYLRRTYGLIPGGQPDGFGRFNLNHDGRAADVGVFRIRSKGGSEWVAFAVTSCKLVQVEPASLLRRNRDLPIGVLCVLDDTVVVRQTLPFSCLTSAKLEQTCRAIAKVAVDLATAVGGTGGASDRTPFDYLAR